MYNIDQLINKRNTSANDIAAKVCNPIQTKAENTINMILGSECEKNHNALLIVALILF